CSYGDGLCCASFQEHFSDREVESGVDIDRRLGVHLVRACSCTPNGACVDQDIAPSDVNCAVFSICRRKLLAGNARWSSWYERRQRLVSNVEHLVRRMLGGADADHGVKGIRQELDRRGEILRAAKG